MEPGTLRAMFTLFMFLAFLGVFVWAWSSRRKSEFDSMANLPLEDDEFVSVGGMPTGVVPTANNGQEKVRQGKVRHGKAPQGEDE